MFIVTKEFLEEFSLFKKLSFTKVGGYFSQIEKVPINMSCPKCSSVQTFNMINEYYYDGLDHTNSTLESKIFDLRYVCQSCKLFERRFFIHFDNNLGIIYKIGQFPEWEIKIDKNVGKVLDKHLKSFRKGLVCESQGYGIGAFAYYRRITEDIIDELLDSISDLIEEDNRSKYLEALEETKKTRVTQEKIVLIKDLLPSILKPGGMNPLGVLHSELSGGLHSESDEECLEKANHVKSILTFLINQVLKSKEEAKNFSDSMKFLLDKKSAKV